ncbi:hypothetical protein GCM10009687_39800 [Asanoa iriomotensis]|uniref:Cytidyltransferase-like domain-containing protein n=1 Tax=Asanoa iriomotensis TaxID=234613 RepID=A0ABQ4C4T5_9ACTN|nr:hypothetical protein Air01nite_38960 [Asanoa iriomotensis]
MIDGADQPVAVWIGRMHPYHLGHFRILERSLQVLPTEHLVAFVCTEFGSASHGPFDVFAPNERRTMLSLILAAEGLASRVDSVFVPKFDEPRWGLLRPFLPRRTVRCTSNKDASDLRRVEVWKRLGWETALIDVSDLEVVTSTELRGSLGAGAGWKRFLHPATHDFFADIDGPSRMVPPPGRIR